MSDCSYIGIYLIERYSNDLTFFKAHFQRVVFFYSYNQLVMDCDSHCSCLFVPLYIDNISLPVHFAQSLRIPIGFYEQRCQEWQFYQLERFLPQKLSLEFDRHTLLLKRGCEQLRILKQDIIYIESDKMYAYVHTAGGTLRFRIQLRELLLRLNDKGFQRCHQSFIVNMDYIYSLKRYEITLRNGVCIPVSKAYSKQVRCAFQKLCEMG